MMIEKQTRPDGKTYYLVSIWFWRFWMVYSLLTGIILEATFIWIGQHVHIEVKL